MKRLVTAGFLNLILIASAFSQLSSKLANPSYMYNSNPGFVNTTEINGAIGLGDTALINTRYYYGITNIFGYQINRNFSGGIGIGYLHYETMQHIPVFLEFRYNTYLKRISPFTFAGGGVLLDPADLNHLTKIFINPGIGLSRSFSQKLEGSLAAGITVQMGDNTPRISFINIKLGIIFREQSFRLFKPA